jgi:hypothetical protein
MAAENSSQAIPAEPSVEVMDASEEEDYLDSDAYIIGLGLLESLPKSPQVPCTPNVCDAADFDQDKAKFYAPIPWTQHSPTELGLAGSDWIDWDGGKVGGRPVRRCCERFVSSILPTFFAGLAFS